MSPGSRCAPAHAATCSDSTVRAGARSGPGCGQGRPWGGGGCVQAQSQGGLPPDLGGSGAEARLQSGLGGSLESSRGGARSQARGLWGACSQAWGLGGGLDSGLGVGWVPGGTTWPVSRRSSQELAGDGWPHAPRRHDPLPGRAVAWGSSPLGSGCWERCPTCLRGSRGGGSLGPSHTSSWLPGRGTHPERSSGRPWAPLQKCSAHTAEPAPRRVNCGSGAGAAMRLPVEGGGPT